MNNQENRKTNTHESKPVWQAPTLVEFQDELKPQGGGFPDAVENGGYFPS